jgi:hypothetical protein
MYTFDRGVDLPPRAREKGMYVFTGTISLRIEAEEEEEEEEETARGRESGEANGVVAAETETDARNRSSSRKSFIVCGAVRDLEVLRVDRDTLGEDAGMGTEA